MLINLRFSARPLPIAVSMLALAAGADAQSLTQGASAPTTAAPLQSLTYGVDAGVAHSDNVTLVPTDKVGQTMAIADVDFDYKQQTRRLDADAKGNFSYLDYLQNAYGNQLIGRFDGTARVALIPERLIWVVQDDFGQSALDPFTPTTPVNLENINYLSTGPDLHLRLGPANFVDLSARYARAQYETSPFNSNRLQGGVAAGRQLSAQSTLSVNADTERVMFANTALNVDFDRTNGYVRYAVQGARTDLSVDLGGTRIAQGDAATNGGLAKIELARKISPAARLTFSAGRYLTDASTSFSGLQSGAIGVVGSAPAAVTADNYTANYVSAGWVYHRSRTTVALSGRWEKDIYGAQPSLDRSLGGGELSIERRLTHSLTARLLGHIYKTDYVHAVVTPLSGSSNYDDDLIGAELAWRHGRGLEVRFRAQHSSRVTAGIDNGYKENRVMLTLGYRPKVGSSTSDPGADAPGP